ncbi:MAG: NAD(P)H-dependent oxidoreductase subunit E [Candidatus Paceibacterota bacterium]
MIELKEAEKMVDKLAAKNGKLLISLLEEVQAYYNYLPEEALRAVSKKSKIPLRDVYGVATFYNAFRMKPCGKHLVCVCLGTACHVRGSMRVLDKIENRLNVKAGGTTSDKKFTLETVNCLGACALGPVMVIDGKYHGNMTAAKVDNVLKDSESKKRNKK